MIKDFENDGIREVTAPVQYPNIIVIMNEAFSDLRVLGDFDTDAPFLKNWDALDENVIRGWANVSVLGGNTANSEFEFLSSDTLGAFPSVVPYLQYFGASTEYLGLTSHLNNLGYETTAFHPYYANGWNRMQVYPAMGFEHTIFMDDVEKEYSLEKLRGYTTDSADYSVIIDWFEKKRTAAPQFFFNITMQNHSGYTEEGFKSTVHLTEAQKGMFPQAEQYLSLVKCSDEAITELLDFFGEYEEPVIVVIFGDHQPCLEPEFYEYVFGTSENEWTDEQRLSMYKTPFIIWHNYEVEYQDLGDVSLNYLAAVMLKEVGIPLTEYQEYVLQLRKSYPVISGMGLVDAEGNYYSIDEEEYGINTEDYRTLIYNHTADQKNRLGNFYGMGD